MTTPDLQTLSDTIRGLLAAVPQRQEDAPSESALQAIIQRGEFRPAEDGDVIITRHVTALTNLFIPGFWPHAALYVSTREQRTAAKFTFDPTKEQLWTDDHCVLEAR